MADIAFSVCTLLGFLLCIPPAYFNWKIPGRPWATLIFIGWIALFNLLSFIDSLIWSNPDSSTWWNGDVYCDIDSRIKSVFQIGLPAAGIGICRFLADATNPDPSLTDLRHTRRRRNMIDLFLGIGLPLINIGLKCIVNPSRYYLDGVSGCTGITDLSWPSIPLYHLWCPLLSFAAAAYSVVFLRHWWVHRKRLNDEWRRGTRQGISKAEFRRLQLTVLSVILFYFPFSIYTFVETVKLPRIPFSWNRIHGPTWGIVVSLPLNKATLGMWLGPILAFTSFFFIGTTRNARRFYVRCLVWVCDHTPLKYIPVISRFSREWKEREVAQQMILQGTISVIDGNKHIRGGRAAKHWFDSDHEQEQEQDSEDDTRSMPSSEATLTPKDEKLDPGVQLHPPSRALTFQKSEPRPIGPDRV